jgi:hypothetical protein
MGVLVQNERNEYKISCNIPELQAYLEKVEQKNYITVDPTKLTWDPVLFNRVNLSNYTQ